MGRWNASRSEMEAIVRARNRAAKTEGSRSVALATPVKLARSGESPNSQESIALAQVKKKWEVSSFQSWMFFHVNSRKFFLRTP